METPKAVVPEPTDLQDGWTKVPERKKQDQVWNVRSADWTAEVPDVNKFAEGFIDPSRAALFAVIQAEDGDAWLELRSLVASAEGDGKPRPRVTAVMPGQERNMKQDAPSKQWEENSRKCQDSVERKIMYKQCYVTPMQHTAGPQLRTARFQIDAPKVSGLDGDCSNTSENGKGMDPQSSHF